MTKIPLIVVHDFDLPQTMAFSSDLQTKAHSIPQLTIHTVEMYVLAPSMHWVQEY